MRKPVFWVSDQIRRKLGCTTTEDGQRLEILDLRRREIDIVLTKELIRCAASVQVICFHISKSRFSHNVAHSFLHILSFKQLNKFIF